MWRAVYAGADRVLHEVKEIAGLAPLLAGGKGNLWIDLLQATREEEAILSEVLRLDPLAIEDCVTDVHHPKVDDYGTYHYLAVHGVKHGSERGDIETRELDIVLAKAYLLTYRHDPMRSVDTAWQQCLRQPKLLAEGPDLLLPHVLACQADHYVEEVERLQREALEVEARIFADQGREFGQTLFDIRADMSRLRGILGPQRDLLHRLSRGDLALIREGARMQYRDVYDDLYRSTEALDTLREIVTALIDTHLNLMANRTNQIVKALTVLMTFLMPLTLITGWFGMNFKHMTGLPWRFGELAVLGVFMVVTGGIALWLRRKKWI